VVAVKAIACELPRQLGLPLARLHVPDIRGAVLQRGLAASISGTTIWQWLAEDAIQPWRHRSWIFARDPDFAVKAGRVLNLNARQFGGHRPGLGEYVPSADEKSSIQARIRCHATVAANSRHPMLVEHEYERGGSLAYLAAWDVHRAKLFGRLESTAGIQPFGRLVSQVMVEEPYRSARHVFWVLDNGSSHRGAPSVRRLREAHKNLVPLHLPIHASWLNQAKSIPRSSNGKSSRRPPSRRSTSSPPTSSTSRLATKFSPNPFEWKFTRADLAKLLERLASKHLDQRAVAA
jgi:hypothetical protein